MTARDRILGSIKGLATGDAVGKQTETLSSDAIARWYPDGIRGFEGLPGTVIPRYTGNRKRQWLIGETTDDTERTIAVALAICTHFVHARSALPTVACLTAFSRRPLTVVPLAIALATVMDSASSAILLAANVGGDSDSVASIAGAILGARVPESVSEEWYGIVEAINGHRLVALGEALSALRS